MKKSDLILWFLMALLLTIVYSCKSTEDLPIDTEQVSKVEVIEPSLDEKPIEKIDVIEATPGSASPATEEEYFLDEVVIADDDVTAKTATRVSSKIAVKSAAPMAMSRKVGPYEGTETVRTDYPITKDAPKAGQITAAEWNDLHNWEDWNELLNNQDYNEMQTHWGMYPRSRYSIFVRNDYELPLQDIQVELLAENGTVLWRAKTDNAGRAELWSDINTRDKSFERVNARVIVDGVTHQIKDLKSFAEGVNHLSVDIECQTSSYVDVLFVVDATGSMGDEIAYLQSELSDVIDRSTASNASLSLRTGAVFYRDSTDEYLTQVQPLTDDNQSTLSFISNQKAAGGGDYPEAVDAAMSEALAQDWSEDAVARIIFLLLDAPPHHDPEVLARIQGQVAEAATIGIKIIPITASGINRQTEFLMKFMAIATNGTYVFITDHSGIGNPHLDPVVKDYEVEKLNDLMVRLLYHYTKSNGCNANTPPPTKSITLYPNPATTFLKVATEHPLHSVKVLANSGKLVHSQKDLSAGETTVDLSGLVDGVYTVHCQGDDVDLVQSVVVVHNK